MNDANLEGMNFVQTLQAYSTMYDVNTIAQGYYEVFKHEAHFTQATNHFKSIGQNDYAVSFEEDVFIELNMQHEQGTMYAANTLTAKLANTYTIDFPQGIILPIDDNYVMYDIIFTHGICTPQKINHVRRMAYMHVKNNEAFEEFLLLSSPKSLKRLYIKRKRNR